MFQRTNELDGAWEEPGVIGIRVEIEGNRIVVLWRNAPVLTTTFRTKKVDEGLTLALREKGLRYENAVSDYATVTGLVYRDGALTFTEEFPITGESVTTLKKTGRSRFGDVEFCDALLDELQGEWVEQTYGAVLSVRRNVMTLRGRTAPIRLVRQRSGGPIEIRDADPSVYEWCGIAQLIYEGTQITGLQRVFDAPSCPLTFVKKG